MKKQTKLDRYRIFAKRKLSAFLKSLEFSRLKGRVNGPKVLVNSIPKAGTNLLDRVLYEMPGIHFSGRRTLRNVTHTKKAVLRILSNTSRGAYHLAHLEHDAAIAQRLTEKNFKNFLMVRDPRSVIVSHYKYVTYIDTNHKTHAYFKSLKSDEARLEAVIKGVPGIVEPIEKVFHAFTNWLSEDCMLVRFEDLIGGEGGGSAEKQLLVIRDAANHLGIALDKDEVTRIASKVFSKKSPTFRSGKIRDWENHISIENRQLIKEKLGEWLIEFGYEQDLSW